MVDYDIEQKLAAVIVRARRVCAKDWVLDWDGGIRSLRLCGRATLSAQRGSTDRDTDACHVAASCMYLSGRSGVAHTVSAKVRNYATPNAERRRENFRRLIHVVRSLIGQV